jgi:hypothetical protein
VLVSSGCSCSAFAPLLAAADVAALDVAEGVVALRRIIIVAHQLRVIAAHHRRRAGGHLAVGVYLALTPEAGAADRQAISSAAMVMESVSFIVCLPSVRVAPRSNAVFKVSFRSMVYDG